jgi:hypothetical protein
VKHRKIFAPERSFRLNSVEKICALAAARPERREGSMAARRIALSNSCKG